MNDHTRHGNTLSDFNLVGTFTSMEDGRKAYMALERLGKDGVTVSLLGPSMDEAEQREKTSDVDAGIARDTLKGVTKGAGIGAAGGAAAGATAVLASVAIPGVGVAVGAGVLIGALVGAIGGGSAGGVVGGIANLPNGDGWDMTYADVRDGRTVVAVHLQTSDDIDELRQLLESHGATRTVVVNRNGALV